MQNNVCPVCERLPIGCYCPPGAGFSNYFKKNQRQLSAPRENNNSVSNGNNSEVGNGNHPTNNDTLFNDYQGMYHSVDKSNELYDTVDSNHQLASFHYHRRPEAQSSFDSTFSFNNGYEADDTFMDEVTSFYQPAFVPTKVGNGPGPALEETVDPATLITYPTEPIDLTGNDDENMSAQQVAQLTGQVGQEATPQRGIHEYLSFAERVERNQSSSRVGGNPLLTAAALRAKPNNPPPRYTTFESGGRMYVKQGDVTVRATSSNEVLSGRTPLPSHTLRDRIHSIERMSEDMKACFGRLLGLMNGSNHGEVFPVELIEMQSHQRAIDNALDGLGAFMKELTKRHC